MTYRPAPPPPQWPPPAPARPAGTPPPPALPLRLDESMAAIRAQDPAPWGVRPVVIPLAAFAGLIVVGQVVTALIKPTTDTGKVLLSVVGTFVVEGALIGAVWLAGRDVARRNGGWGRAFGWRRPRPVDLGWAAAGFGFVVAGEVAVTVVANLFTHGTAGGQAQNVHLRSVSVLSVAFLIVVTVVFAPLTEELVFRGLLLRTFMRRLSFWPAAVLSSLIFAIFHTYEVDTLTGAIVLALTVGWMGFVNCVLNRLTDRLAAGIGVHAALNATATVVLVAQAAHLVR